MTNQEIQILQALQATAPQLQVTLDRSSSYSSGLLEIHDPDPSQEYITTFLGTLSDLDQELPTLDFDSANFVVAYTQDHDAGLTTGQVILAGSPTPGRFVRAYQALLADQD
jgi:hypothetical protein